MNSSSNTSYKKKLLFISLFIVPFLAGMALIFMGKGIGTLPTLHQTGTKEIEGKKIKTYYAVPDFVINDFTNGKIEFSSKDSSIYLITLFDKKNSTQWEKHMMYITKIFQRYNNVKILSIYEGNPNEFKWAENPVPYFKQFPKWVTGWAETSEFNEIIKGFKTKPDSITGIYPYIIVDKSKHIRTYCDINDLKASRDIPKLLKILNNQYAPRRVKITQKPNE
jgi:hypothetical protein